MANIPNKQRIVQLINHFNTNYLDSWVRVAPHFEDRYFNPVHSSIRHAEDRAWDLMQYNGRCALYYYYTGQFHELQYTHLPRFALLALCAWPDLKMFDMTPDVAKMLNDITDDEDLKYQFLLLHPTIAVMNGDI